MKVNEVKVESAEKENFKVFKLKNDFTSKLEFINYIMFYQIKYSDEEMGNYNALNLDQMIVEYLEKLADYNDGDSINVKGRLDNLVEHKSTAFYQKYQTTYKNSELKYLLGLENNIIKNTCIEQKITYQQLADIIGVSESSLRSSASTNKVSKQIERSIEMYLKIIHLEKELEKIDIIKTAFKSWLE